MNKNNEAIIKNQYLVKLITAVLLRLNSDELILLIFILNKDFTFVNGL